MPERKKHRTINEFLQYLKGETSGRERHSFERDLERDPFVQEALEGFEQISATEAEDDLLSLHQRLARRRSRKRRITWYSMAAAVASILIVGTIFIQIYDFSPAESEQTGMLEEAAPGEVPAAMDKKTVEEPAAAGEGALSEDMPEMDPDTPPAADEEPEDSGPAPPQVVANEATEAQMEERKTIQPEQAAQESESRGAREISAPPAAEPQAQRDDLEEMVVVEAVPAPRMKSESLGRTAYEEITGTVLSAEDSTPVPGASLYVEGERAVAISDVEGRFSISVTRETPSSVTASLTGMETEKVAIPADEEFTIVLRPESEKAMDPSALAMRKKESSDDPDQPEAQLRSAEPSGGYDSFYVYLEKNRRSFEKDTAVTEALVVLRFLVTAQGKISDIVAAKSPGEPYTKEAIRLLKKGPQWIPAFDENGTIDQEVTLRIML